MNHHSVVFRTANPTINEGLVCGQYLDEVAEGFFRLMLGNRFAEIIALAYTQPNHSYSFENVIFAECDERIVGMALGFTAERHRNFSAQPLKVAAGIRALRMKIVNILFSPMLQILKTIAAGDYYLLSMAVENEFRGKGIGTTLIDSIEERARTNGSIRLSLDVSAKNEEARRLYEHRGMNIESQWPKRIPIPGMKFYRMAKLL
ncbi:GNAT family N-acetyltransferase [Desulfobacterales bacterium HSG17]|nr:GNAT family N-acetyltransferase [Desulfobacterales bacterium HSG17]